MTIRSLSLTVAASLLAASVALPALADTLPSKSPTARSQDRFAGLGARMENSVLLTSPHDLRLDQGGVHGAFRAH